MDGAPHKFRLERVRALRERSEDQAKQALADSLARHNAAEESVAAAQARILAARDAMSGTTGIAMDAAALRARQAYMERTEVAHQESLKTLDGHVREVNVSRAKLIEAARQRQSMDRLRDRSLAAHKLAAGRREAATLDEIALNTYRRKVAA